MKKLTVCITTYNRWELCEKAIIGILDQTVELDQIIIVDDASTEKITDSVCKLISDHSIEYIRNENNRGLAASRNVAIKASDSKYFAFCDDDDVWTKDMARTLLDSIEEGGDAAFGLSHSYKMSCGNFFGKKLLMRELLLNGFAPPVSSQIYKLSLLKSIGGYDENICSGVDHDLWISLSAVSATVAIAWDALAIAGNDLNINRITTDENIRRSRVIESLSHWRPKISDTFGEDFYDYFYHEYISHIDVSFFIISLKRRKYLRAFQLLFTVSVQKKIFQKFIEMILGRQKCGYFRPYVKTNG